MSTVIDTLITDRTQTDVDALIAALKAGINPVDHKGSYNASDLNRVGEAVNYLRGRLFGIGISRHLETEARTNWTAADIPKQSQMKQYLDYVWEIWISIMAYRPETELPWEMAYLDYQGANQIEDLLREAELTVSRIELSFRGYSGRQISGVNCLP